MEEKAPLTLNAFVQFLATTVVRHYRTTGRPMHGASLANSIRWQFPGFSYEQFGIARLADAVEEAERQGLVRRDRQVLHMAVLPGPSVDMAMLPTAGQGGGFVREHVRTDIWRAVVFLPKRQDRFYDRETGRLTDSQEDPSTDLDESPRYVKLRPVESDEQREWVRSYFKDTTDFPEEVLEGDRWWADFADWLKQQDRETAGRWNRHRAQKVRGFLKEWAHSNNIPVAGLFTPRIPVQPTRSSEDASEGQRIRNAVARIVGEMELDELKNLQLPLKYVLRYFRVR